MNIPPFIVQEAVQVACTWGHVVILAKQPTEVLDKLIGCSDEKYVRKISRANGQVGIDFHSGWTIRIIRHVDEIRGRTADLAIIPIGVSHEDMEAIRPCIKGTKSGAIVGYY